MRLLSSTIRNYRIHREVSIDFDDSLSLIGGKNETGKSTLAEAIHRGLFLKATTGGKIHEAMQSSIHNGHPEVEISFEASGKHWDLKKVFSKTSGKTILSESGGTTLHGSDAEARLSELMRIEEPGSGIAGAKKSLAQWAHLWVWQGSGGDDPSEHAADQKDALLSRLKDQGGGAVMQSDLDSHIVRHFQDEYETIFTKGGQPKAGSDLFIAIQEKEAAGIALKDARAEYHRLESAASDYEEAVAILKSGEVQIAELKGSLEEAQRKAKQATELRHRIEIGKRKCEEADQNFQNFVANTREITRLEERLKEVEASGKPGQQKSKSLEEKKKREIEATASIEKQIEQTEAALTEAREKKELAEAWGYLLKNRERIADLSETLKKVEAMEAERKVLLEKIAALPPIDEPTYQSLQSLEIASSEAFAVLEAMSTGIKIIRAGKSVQVGEDTLTPGDQRIIHHETSVSIGDEVELRISPGGGTDLEKARSEARQREADRDSALRDLGIKQFDEAGKLKGVRLSLEEKKREIESALSTTRPEEIRAQKEETSQEIIRYEAEIGRRRSSVPNFSPPDTFQGARNLWETYRNQLEPIDGELQSVRQRAKEARAVLEATTQELHQIQKAISEAERERVEISTLLQVKQKPLGDLEAREKTRDELETARDQAGKSLQQLREEWTALLPDSIESDINRFGRALEVRKEELESAGQKKAVANSMLTRDGSADPAADLSRAKAQAESTAERHRSLSQRAEAIRLLRDRFAEEQQKLSDQFSQPLADKVTQYLTRIFGPSAQATVSVEDGMIGGWKMTRDRGTFEFADLSGGTREQVAAAVRLALAEILSADHGGTLPIVFDDAFTNSDPVRIQSLQSMLDLASQNGLQVILLTCTPEDYIGLGARRVTLSGSTNQTES